MAPTTWQHLTAARHPAAPPNARCRRRRWSAGKALAPHPIGVSDICAAPTAAARPVGGTARGARTAGGLLRPSQMVPRPDQCQGTPTNEIWKAAAPRGSWPNSAAAAAATAGAQTVGRGASCCAPLFLAPLTRCPLMNHGRSRDFKSFLSRLWCPERLRCTASHPDALQPHSPALPLSLGVTCACVASRR